MNLDRDFVEYALQEYEEKKTPWCFFYHNRRHVVRMLQGFGFCVERIRMSRGFQGEPFFSRLDLMMGEAAILFHDAAMAHGHRQEGHEKASAEIAGKELSQLCWSRRDVEIVKRMIEGTEVFGEPPSFECPEGGRREQNLQEISGLARDLNLAPFLDFTALKANEERLMCEIRCMKTKEEAEKERIEFFSEVCESLKKGEFFRSELFATAENDQAALKNAGLMIESYKCR